MKKFFNKSGSFTVFATMIFVSLVCVLWIIIRSAGNLAIEGTINNFGTLWCKSILAEYDVVLRDRYGLLAFYGNEDSVEKTLLKYIDYSLEYKDYIVYGKPKCSLEQYNLTNPDNLIKQIEYVALENTKPKVYYHEEQKEYEPLSISNPWIIESLPSYKKTEKMYITGLVNKLKNDSNVESMIENVAVNKYIFNFFKDYMNERDLGKTYFNLEIEYIISGQLSELDSKNFVDDKIVIVRNILNLLYLYTSQEKRDSALALATAISPGAMAFITQGIILETWAFVEAKNDLKLLYDNKAVALLKTDENWALTLENVFNINEDTDDLTIKEETEYVLPKKIEGVPYEDYLKLLLYGIPEETKLLRIMDLIQINMKYCYCDYFLIKDYNCGTSYSLKVNNREHSFDDEYV